jgi:hypothetical protein
VEYARGVQDRQVDSSWIFVGEDNLLILTMGGIGSACLCVCKAVFYNIAYSCMHRMALYGVLYSFTVYFCLFLGI